MDKAYINNVQYHLPEKIESNSEILQSAKYDNTKIDKMIEKIGIVSRRIASDAEYSNDLGIIAGKKILKNYDSKQIQYLIFCTNTPEYSLPTNACIIQDKLGLEKNIGAIDIILACSGYVYSLSLAKSLILSDQAKQILLITSDTYSKFISKKDAGTRILFGSSEISISLKTETPSSFCDSWPHEFCLDLKY